MMIEAILMILWLAACYVAGYLLGAAIAEWLAYRNFYVKHMHG